MKEAIAELLKIAHELSTRKVTASDLYVDAITNAIKALQYTPIEYAFQDRRKRDMVKRQRDSIVNQLEALLNEMPSKVTYQVVGVGKPVKFDDMEQLIAFMKQNGFSLKRYHDRPGARPWLNGQPEFSGILGPMSDGPKAVRYETQEVYNELSV